MPGDDTGSQRDSSNKQRSHEMLSRIREPWKQPLFSRTFLSKSSILIGFMIICCIVLTIFARSGELIFNNQTISWKLILYNILLEAMYLIVTSDLLSIAFDYFLTTGGVTIQQLGHAIGNATNLNIALRGFSYSEFFYLITAVTALIPPLLLSLVLRKTSDYSSYRVRAIDQLVRTNALGGRSGDNFGMTGHLFLFTSVREKYNFTATRQQYVFYERSSTTRTVFVPKTPQIGTYAEDVNSDEGKYIVQARVLGVQGLLYQCSPTVREESKSIYDFQDINGNLRREHFRLLERKMAPAVEGDKTKATLDLTIAIKQGDLSTAVLTIPCSVTAAQGDLNINKEDDGFMSMSVTGPLNELSLPLPGRVLGTKESLLDVAIENSIGSLGINIVREYVANNERLEEWDGLIRCLVGAFGIRSAIHDTFADENAKRLATNVWMAGPRKSRVEHLRVLFIWVPIIVVIMGRLLTIVFPSVLTEGVWQVSEWLPRKLTDDAVNAGDENREFVLGLQERFGQWSLKFRRSTSTDEHVEDMSWSSVRSIRRRLKIHEREAKKLNEDHPEG